MPAFDDAIARMRESLYAKAGVAAVWTPAGASPLDLTVIPQLGDALPEITSIGVRVTPLSSVRARVSEVAAVGAGREPAAGDSLTIGTAAFVINGQPTREDNRRAEWTLHLGPA